MAASRSALGERWLDVYLTSPAWRFTGARRHVRARAGHRPDGAERRSRRTLLSSDDCRGTAAARQPDRRGHRGRIVLRRRRAPDDRDARSGVRRFRELRPARDLIWPTNWRSSADRRAWCSTGRRRRSWTATAQACWQLPIGSAEDLAPAFEQLLSHRLSATYDPLMIWWTEGSSIVEPSCLIARGLPQSRYVCGAPGRLVAAASLAAGSGTRRAGGRAAGDLAVDEPALQLSIGRGQRRRPGAPRSIRIRSSSGPRWASGSSPTGSAATATARLASRMVCDAFADFAPARQFRGDDRGCARPRCRRSTTICCSRRSRSLLGERAAAPSWSCSCGASSAPSCGRVTAGSTAGVPAGWNS